MHPIRRLAELGQSVWLDFLDHRLIASGELRHLIEEEGLRGLTSNPTIFQKSMAASSDYDGLIRSGPSTESDAAVFERAEVHEVALACDEFRRLYDESGGADGFVSIEVSPHLAYDTAGSIAEARRLWSEVARPNLMVKIPGTREGLLAIEQCLSEGINVNITLLFSVERYLEVAEIYLRVLEARIAEGKPVDRLASVASFFVSRVDTKVDKALDQLTGSKHECGRLERGKAAVANAKLAFAEYERLFSGARWSRMAQRGARPQRVLWASTSTKDPAYPDLYYAEALVGPWTVDTMTRETFEAYVDHGEPEIRLTSDVAEARAHIDALATLGLDFPRMMQELEDEGVQSFSRSFDEALGGIRRKRQMLRSA
jgi:transaldolase